MSGFWHQTSRRRFITTAGVAAGAVLIKGCLGNPPERGAGSSSQSQQVEAANLTPEITPETTKVKLGYLPIVEAAPLIIAQELGFFKRWGMTEVELAKQASWGSMRDNTEIGSAGGGVDGGQYQMPMPHLITEGLITKGNAKIPMYILAQLNTQGNGIAIASKHAGKQVHLDLSKGGKAVFDKLKSTPSPFTAAFTFGKVNQEFWLRYWLAAGGVNPDTDVKLIPVPTAQTVANMRTGTVDAFSTGDPWPYRIVKDKIGFISALTAQIWKNHPEEYLAIRGEWVDANPKATKAILKAVMEAQQWLDKFENRETAANILGRTNYYNISPSFLTDPFQGNYDMGDGQKVNDKSMAVLYWKDERGSVSYPYKSHDLWFLTESIRWGFLPAEYLEKSEDLINRVNKENIWREAAKELGIPDADIPTSTSRGLEKFFDGITFDPSDPRGYLKGLKIKKINI
ncbi:CmpA/NrtA family ABC transporter substrate-binding protein [Cylindrospermopsis raciborskii]|uniref:Bicarbonate-binding protein n=1 Tax=Cylindrospermopsis raciborskii CENA302 TaxID=1170768 RepID=A0A9Q5QXI1_9CYAN|nr:CmpA/NrtA family ABC transporter substrate-binding protein [Cylindrospermopsis raciborskii]NLQ05288.1 ABC transporter substrate-binding protein [Cylindrospermopsis raciborskii MVCC19]OHY33145.1 bicarbonate-binding protein [Cylindrospermopsis raciborskii MVCC14]OPH10222.1 bicarbonate-binding protein [Cylindrospermopsis raciborskii CENA302]